MSTFNAGAIEATLTLDRSPWNRELKAAQAQANRFSAKKISPKLDIDGLEKLTALGALLESLDSQKIDIDIDVNGKDDLAMAALLVNNLDGKDIDLNIDVNGYGELMTAKAIVETLDGSDIDIDIDKGGAIGHAVSGFSRMQALVLAILLLLPLMAPMIASLAAAMAALTAGLVGAAGALGVVGLGVAPTVKNMMELNEEIQKQETRLASLTPGTKAYAKQQEKIANLQKVMNTRFGEASKGLGVLQESWKNWTKETEGPSQQIIGSAFTVAAQALTALIPIFNAAAPVIKGVLDSIGKFMSSGEGEEMIEFFRTFGVDALGQFLSIGGNLLRFFGNLFDAFSPFASDFIGSIDEMTAGWAEWARGLKNSEGFQTFIDYVREEGPRVWDLVKNIAGALINLGIALAPIGDAALDAFNWLFEGMKEMDPSILGAIAVGLGVAAAAILAVTAGIALLNAVLALNPVTLIVIAVIALVAAIVYLWNTNEGFRDAIIAVWDAIVAAVMTAINWLQTNVLPILMTVWEGIKSGFQAVADAINPIIALIVQIVQQAFSNMMAVVGPVMSFIAGAVQMGFGIISAIVSTVMPVVMAVVTGAFNVIKSVVTGAMNVVRAIWSTVWNVIKAVFTAVINTIKAVLTTVLAAMKGDVNGVLNGIKSIFSSVWNGIKSVVTAAINGVKSVISAGMNAAKSVISSIMNAVTGVFRSAWNTVKSVVSGGISAIKGAFSGAGSWLLGAGRSIIQGLIDGIRGMMGNVKSAVGGVLSAARDLLPFSPAKEGPFSGKGWTLYSGRSMIEGLSHGILDRRQMLRDSLRTTLADAVPNTDLELGSNRRGAIATAGTADNRTTTIITNVYNPIGEPTEVTVNRRMQRLAALGVM